MKKFTAIGGLLLAAAFLAGCMKTEVNPDDPSAVVAFDLAPVLSPFADGVALAAASKAAPEVPTAERSLASGRWGDADSTVGVWRIERQADEVLTGEVWDERIAKATETAFEQGDSIGVFVHAAVPIEAKGIHSANLCYTTPNGTAFSTLSKLESALNGTYYATSYYPYQKTVSDPTAVPHAVPVDQSAASVGDFLVAAPAPIEAKGGATVRPTVAVVFAHRMAKLSVSFTVPTRLQSGVVGGVKSVRFHNFSCTCAVDLSASAAPFVKDVGANKPDITPRLTSGTAVPGSLATYSAIVVPQTVAKGTQIVTVVCTTDAGDKELTYSVPASGADMSFASGSQYNLTISPASDLEFPTELQLKDGAAKRVSINLKAAQGEPWTLASTAGWITGITPASGTGTGNVQTVTMNAAANAGSAAREGNLTLTLTSTGAVAVCRVVQGYVLFGAPDAPLSVAAGQQSVAVAPFATNQLWRAWAPTADAWAKMAWGSGAGTSNPIYPASGSHQGDLTAETALHYRLEPNNTLSARTTTITYQAFDEQGNGLPSIKKTVAVTQAAPVLALGAETQTVGADATSAVFAVTAAAGHQGITYTPSAKVGATSVEPSGLQTIGAATAYSADVTVRFPVNPTNAAKTIKADVMYGGGQLIHTITQSAASLTAVSSAAAVPISTAGGTATITITGTAGLTWTVAKTSGDAAFGDPNPASGTCTGAAQEVKVTVAPNAGTDARAADYKVTVTNQGASGLDVSNVAVTQVGSGPSPSDYIYIASTNLYWAKGNLVTTSSTAGGSNGCKIGAPTDGGVYFQFGSLIGFKGGDQANGGTGVGMPQPPLTNYGTWWGGSTYTWAGEAMVWPASMVGTKVTWYNNEAEFEINTLDNYLFCYSMAPWDAEHNQPIHTFALSMPGDTGTGTLGTGRYVPLGVGDPCTYYLGAKWRLPTKDEYLALDAAGRGAWTTNGGVNGLWLGENPGTATSSIFLPAASDRTWGLRGAFSSVGQTGSYWTCSVRSYREAFELTFGKTIFYNPNGRNRGGANPARCVSTNP